MKVIQAPNDYTCFSDEIPCFMAGGLQKCEWHHEFLSELNKYTLNHLVIYNPKRDNYDTNNPTLAEEQIKWEYTYLNKYVNDKYIFSMYFDDSESVQPICFYELGRYLEVMKNNGNLLNCVITVHPKFSRKNDVIIQTELATNGVIEVQENTPSQHAKRVIEVYNNIKYQLK
ncbi:MAG: hypothetical protein ACI4PU_10180 [Intestinibacter sp.]